MTVRTHFIYLTLFTLVYSVTIFTSIFSIPVISDIIHIHAVSAFPANKSTTPNNIANPNNLNNTLLNHTPLASVGANQTISKTNIGNSSQPTLPSTNNQSEFTFVRKWTTHNDGGGPHYLAIDPKTGNLYVTYFEKYSVRKIHK